MSKVVKSVDGTFYLMHNYEVVDFELANELKNHLSDEVAVLTDAVNFLTPKPSEQTQVPVDQATPADVSPAAPVSDPALAQPATDLTQVPVTDPTQVAPVAPVVPAPSIQ